MWAKCGMREDVFWPIVYNFNSGDYIKMRNWKKNSIVYTTVAILKTEENEVFVDQLKRILRRLRQCEREFFLYHHL